MPAIVKKARSAFLVATAFLFFFSLHISAQESDPKVGPVIVQPGAPGQPTKTLPASTRAVLPPRSEKDLQFMQGMIMHHAQAVEMTALIETRTKNEKIRLLGERISQSQSDEIKFMMRWLELRGEPASHSMTTRSSASAHSEHPKEPPEGGTQNEPPKGGTQNKDHMLMPGMLTREQMDALSKAHGAEFDRLFLAGMIQHHNGALVMVKDLFDTAGAGQDAELFTFATDVDSGQRAEIKRMETLLTENP